MNAVTRRALWRLAIALSGIAAVPHQAVGDTLVSADKDSGHRPDGEGVEDLPAEALHGAFVFIEDAGFGEPMVFLDSETAQWGGDPAESMAERARVQQSGNP